MPLRPDKAAQLNSWANVVDGKGVKVRRDAIESRWFSLPPICSSGQAEGDRRSRYGTDVSNTTVEKAKLIELSDRWMLRIKARVGIGTVDEPAPIVC